MQKQKEKKDLKDLGELKGKVAAAKYRLPNLDGLPTIMAPNEAVELKQSLATVVERIREEVRDVCRALNDEANLETLMGDIRKKENELVWRITADGTDPNIVKTLGEAYIKALAEGAPHNQVGLNHIADQGLAVGVAYPSRDGKGVKLPVTPADGGKWDWTDLSFPQSIYPAIRAIASEVSDARNERLEAEKEAVEKGAGRLLDVLKTDEEGVVRGGEAAFYVPDRHEGDRFYGGGTIRVLVKDGLIFPLEACGKCRAVVERAVKVHQGLPLDSLKDGQLHFKERLPKEEYGTLRIFLSICQRGLEYAKEGKRRHDAVESIRAKTTVSATNLVVHNAAGMTYLFLKEWTTKDSEGKEKVWRNVGVLVERNDKGELRLAETQEKCAGLFTEACYSFSAAGDCFKGLPIELGAILRKLYGILSRAEERNERKETPESPPATA